MFSLAPAPYRTLARDATARAPARPHRRHRPARIEVPPTWRCSTALARFNPALFGSALRDAVAFSCWVVPALWEEMPAQARPYSLFFAQALFPTTNPTFNQEFESKFKYDNQNLIYQVYTSHNRSSNHIYITYIDQVII